MCEVIILLFLRSGQLTFHPFFQITGDIQEYWIESDGEIEEDIQQPSPPPLLIDTPERSEDREVNAIVWWILTFVYLFQTLHFIPETAISWLIRFISFLMKFMGKYSPRIMQIAKAIPCSAYQKNMFLNDDSKSVCRYVVCCACHSTFLDERAVLRKSRLTKSIKTMP